MPFLANGRTTFQVVSQRVAPSASAAFALLGGDGQNHFARDRNDERNDHHCQHHAGREHADAVERSREQRSPASTARIAGSKAISAGTRTKIPSNPKITLGTAASSSIRNVSPFGNLAGRQFRQKDRRAHAQRDSHEQSQDGRHHRAINERKRTELPDHGIPSRTAEKRPPELLARQGRVHVQLEYQQRREGQDGQRAGQRDDVRNIVTAAQALPESRSPPRAAGVQCGRGRSCHREDLLDLIDLPSVPWSTTAFGSGA